MVTLSPAKPAFFVFELKLAVSAATFGLTLSLADEALGEDMTTRFPVEVDGLEFEDGILEVVAVLGVEVACEGDEFPIFLLVEVDKC